MKPHHWMVAATLCCALPSQAQFILKEANLDHWHASHHKGTTDYQRTMDLEQGVVLRAVSKKSSSSFT